MDINLKGKAPYANTLEEANKVIKALWDIIKKQTERQKTNSKIPLLLLQKINNQKTNPTSSVMKNAERIRKNKAVNWVIKNMNEPCCHWIQ